MSATTTPATSTAPDSAPTAAPAEAPAGAPGAGKGTQQEKSFRRRIVKTASARYLLHLPPGYDQEPVTAAAHTVKSR